MGNTLVRKIIQFDDVPDAALLEKRRTAYTFLNPVSYLAVRKEEQLFAAFDGIMADGYLLALAIRLLYGWKVRRRSFDMTSLATLLYRLRASRAAGHGLLQLYGQAAPGRDDKGLQSRTV